MWVKTRIPCSWLRWMDLLQDFSDSEPPATVQPPPRGFGRGRHGDERDRRLLAMHMHACKHKLKRERLEDKVVATLRELRPKCRPLQLKVVPPKRYSRQGRQQHTKHGMQLEVCRAKRHRTTTPEALDIAFGQYIIKQGFTQLPRNRDSLAVGGVHQAGTEDQHERGRGWLAPAT